MSNQQFCKLTGLNYNSCDCSNCVAARANITSFAGLIRKNVSPPTPEQSPLPWKAEPYMTDTRKEVYEYWIYDANDILIFSVEDKEQAELIVKSVNQGPVVKRLVEALICLRDEQDGGEHLHQELWEAAMEKANSALDAFRESER